MSINGLEPPPCRLSGEEVQDPYLVLNQLFDFAHLPQVRAFLWDWLRLTVTGGYHRKAGFRSRSSVLIMYEFMEKLVEAAHILHQRQRAEGKGQEALREEVDKIVSLLRPARVYFLGKMGGGGQAAFNLFIVLMPPGGRPLQEYESIMENSQPSLPIMVMVKSLEEVTRLKKEGHPFFSVNCTSENLMYHDGSIPLEEAPVPGQSMEKE